MKSQWLLAMSVSLLATVALQGCATADSPPRFPDPHSATPTGGTFVNVDNLRNVAPGLNKDQMFDLLGPPHFHEWFVGGHVWNYLFDFRRGGDTITCQYQVQFDKDMRVSNTYWRDPACAEFLREAAAVMPVPAEPQVPTVEQFTLQSDALFEFGKSSLDSMLPSGRAALDKTIERIKAHKEIAAITVVGHTDRIGPASANQPLSLARADSVRGYLIAHGLDGSLIHTEGVGSSQPLTHCPDGEVHALTACLQPDRRVSITVQGRG
ncbi:Outer membrane protein OmpA [Paraburkholderia phenazinium]|jgi:outer membrane protein OmpA-like peptidoglycan-associated protein|uniref:Outer membrane protein OmpA n=2 Tax=Paraburkholderia phenazinium TaxID=60549 RepID=A0A1G8FY37_9BURK|nr:OmpA family protein [Paraburkholderia phenazinium]SDH87033.1 Outer membrane protein OmpA [Paraburkholderia phenazinium]